MGALCYKCFDYIDEEGRRICIKCGDRYKPCDAGKSERTSCRVHNYKNMSVYFGDFETVCTTCKRTKHQIKCSNCYHCYYDQ